MLRLWCTCLMDFFGPMLREKRRKKEAITLRLCSLATFPFVLSFLKTFSRDRKRRRKVHSYLALAFLISFFISLVVRIISLFHFLLLLKTGSRSLWTVTLSSVERDADWKEKISDHRLSGRLLLLLPFSAFTFSASASSPQRLEALIWEAKLPARVITRNDNIRSERKRRERRERKLEELASLFQPAIKKQIKSK